MSSWQIFSFAKLGVQGVYLLYHTGVMHLNCINTNLSKIIALGCGALWVLSLWVLDKS